MQKKSQCVETTQPPQKEQGPHIKLVRDRPGSIKTVYSKTAKSAKGSVTRTKGEKYNKNFD